MAAVPTSTKIEKPSFAKVAAAGLKLASAPPNPTSTEVAQKSGIPSSPPQDGANVVSPSNKSSNLAFTPTQKKLVAPTSSSPKETVAGDIAAPEVQVHSADSTTSPSAPLKVLDGMLTPGGADEAGTQLSSSNDSVKPASLDGKSVASGTTFTLDEKESLRPDDSASVMARDDEEVFTHHSAGLPEAPTGSDDERQAFCNQLREISDMDTARQPPHAHGFTPNGNHVQGVLYVPPQGPGVGNVPGLLHVAADTSQTLDSPPDPKLLEALDSPKDRIMVLKLEQDIVDFVKDPKESSLKLPQTNAFYRMLAHKLADYYMLGHVVDESTMAVRIFKTPNCRIPPPLTGIATPSTAASTPPPGSHHMKILRRGVDSAGPTIANGSNFTSKTTSENGESGAEEDKKNLPPASREEREARYEAARKRIMGSDLPTASSEEVPDKDNSRSSSAAGKKGNRKKQRADSDDDFEARSAYSAYYPAPMTPSASASGAYGVPQATHPQSNQFAPAAYGSQMMPGGFPQYAHPSEHTWAIPSYHAQGSPQNWTQSQQSGYDLTGDFQRTMSFQPAHPHPGMQNAGGQQNYRAQYSPQLNGPQQPQPWSQQNAYMVNYPTQPSPSYAQSYPAYDAPASSQVKDSQQPYAYGQLPSQGFPGRPPNNLEHPLPGSYKGKHFNPQSQTFIPSQVNGTNSIHFQPGPSPIPLYNHGIGGSPSPSQRQDSVATQKPSFGLAQYAAMPNRSSNQPMTHPLPQPVFPQQASPSVPLPAKPVTTPSRFADKGNGGSIIPNRRPADVSSQSAGSSSIAKWGAPASLPAKPPPPSNEAFDAAKISQAPTQSQRHTPSGPLPARPSQPHGLPTFGSMPPGSGPASSAGAGAGAAGYGLNAAHVRRM